MNTIRKRLLSLFLCFVLIAGMLPVGAFASETGETATAETTEVTETLTQTASETEELSVSTETSEEESEQTDVSKKDEKNAEKAEKEEEKAAEKEAKQEEKAAEKAAEVSTEPSSDATEPSSEATEPSSEPTEPEVIAVTGITLDQTALEVGVGELPMTLTATILPENATDKTVTWASSEPGVASVEDGVLTFGYMGEAVITATAGGFSASCTVTVGEGEWSGYADDTKDYLFIATDRHANTSVIGNIINNMENAIGENELDYLALGGDMVGSGNSHPTYNSSTVLNEVTGATASLSAENVDIVAGIHDMNVNDDAGIVLPYQGGGAQIYEGDRFYVYGVEEYCISDDSNSSNWSSEAQKFVTWANGSDIDQSKVIIVVSHYPLHAKRDDNDGAYYWHQALNTVATGAASGDSTVERNIVFFHGHNHTVDSNEYVYDVGDTMSVQNGSSTTSDTIYYTYATAGYLNQNSKATLVAIADDEIALTKYGTSGNGTAMASLERAVTAPAPTVNTVECWDDTEQVIVEATGLGLTAVAATNVTDDNAKCDEVFTENGYMAFDIALEGYTEGEVTYSISVVPDLDITNLELYYIDENGDLIPMDCQVTTDELNNVYVEFTADHDGTFVYGSPNVPEGYTLTSLTLANIPTDVFLGGSLVLDETAEITATYTMEGAEDFVRKLTIYDYDVNNFSGFDVNVAGKQAVTFTFEGLSVTHDIYVWGETFTDETTKVSISVANGETADYGVTAANVAESTNEHVAAAVADVMQGKNYVAYDITLTLDENYTLTDSEKTVTLPIPVGVTNPVVYYVSDDGATVENMNAVKTEDGTGVTFTTTHFSTYVVGEGTGTNIEVPDPETATGSGETTTTTKKTVYVLTSSISSGNEYLIVNGNSAGSYYALANNSGSVAATGVTVKTDSEIGTYIELDDATDELWTLSANIGSNTNSTIKNGNYYLYSGSNGGLNLDDSTGNYTNWRLNNNQLYRYRRNYTSYYLRYNSGWTTTSSSNSATSIYFYVPTEVEVETTTPVSGTYSIAGNPAEVTKVVTNGSTAELNSVLTFVPSNGGSATTTENPSGATYEIYSDPNGVISGINGNTVTFSGKYGKALVKVSCEVKFGEETKTVTNYITVNASEPTYTLDITMGETVLTGTTIAYKGVTNGQTLQLETKIQYVDEDGAETIELPEGATIEWHIPEEYHGVATVEQETGLVSFKGVNGAFYVTATLTMNGKDYTVGVNISATTTNYTVPSDGVGDFPEYPNEGAIRFDKTATAVGNFSETGIAQVELSMTGVPYTTGSEIDVVVMLDMTGSMSDDGMEAAELATIAFMEKIVKNEDGNYNENRIAVYAFNSGSSSPYELVSLKKITSDAELATATTAIRTASDKQASGGTPFDKAAEKCYDVLQAAKTDGTGNDRQQFCVFMSDGGPTTYKGSDGYTYYGGNASGDRKITSYIGGYTSSSSSSWTYNLPTEYYTDAMKNTGVTVYTVGLLLQNAPSNPAPYSSMTDSTYDSTTDSLTSIGSHYYFTSTILKNMASDSSKYIDIFDVDNADKATAAFESIAKSILQAATNVTVEDQIGDNYTMIFDIPTTTTANGPEIDGVTNDFYIEFGKYALDEDHERTTFTSVTKVYLENNNGTLSAKDATDPVFEQKTIGEKGSLYYWSTNAADGDAGISVEVDGTTYYFVSYGMEEAGYNMTSGAYANGTVEDTNMSENLVIATPYFVYNAATKMLYWTVDKLDTEEYALRYFVYLNNSATEVGTDKETDPGSYLTNDHAYITYTNFNGNECRQEFDKPQLTWNGAQVSYVFYLVNAQGQPINKSGQVVDFANATFITDIYTESVVWNKEGDTTTGTGQLSANWLADDLLPDDYEIYDAQARYVLNVYENADGTTIKNQFTISGDTAANISSSLNTRLELETTASTVSIATTKVYNTKAGEKISAYGTYTSADSNMADFDFANTTVAFAVVWQPRLVEDAVVVDYGLDVLINVVQNDILQNSVSGIGLGKDAYDNENVAMNTGVTQTSKLGTAALDIDGNTISIENETAVRFHQNDMEFDKPVVFYYETPVEFWEGSDPTEGYMYSSVTVIPATTVYYEDSFVTFTNSTSADGTYGTWTSTGTTTSATQAQDRPGVSKISADLDADNNYGYDAAYSAMSQYSLGSSMKVSVKSGISGMASFDFYGTGFDVISMTSNTTGTIIVQVYDEDNEKVQNVAVDTYYGYTRDTDGNWIVDKSADNALYQVPVMKVSGLPYGKYTAKIVASYASMFDNTDADSYDFYLDAIRIYDPTGNLDETANNAYAADGEGWPTYFEVRNEIIDAKTFESVDTNPVNGIVFIDGISNCASVTDYTSYGPNNETYLAAGQAIAFDLNAAAVENTKVAEVQLAVKTVGGSASVKVYSTDGTTALDADITTATDMYYDITDLNDKTVVIMNDGDDGILSITNVKVTYTADQSAAETSGVFMLRRASVDAALATMSVEEEEVPETTVPEETEPEETVPETTVPEETETEATEPETTGPDAEEPDTEEDSIQQTIQNVVNTVVNALKNLFSRWFS